MSIRPDAVQLLAHMVEATALITRWTAGRTLEDYSQDPFLRSAVERQFINIGEAMNLLRDIEPSAATRISNHRRIISFRNVLVHEFFQVNDLRTWNTVVEHLPILHREVSDIFREYEED